MSNNPIQLCVQYIQSGDLDRAESTIRQLLAQNRAHVQGLCLLGLIRQARGSLPEALELFKEAARADPRSDAPYTYMGALFVQARQPNEAVACLEQSLRLAPFSPDAYNNLGKAHLLQKRNDEALSCFREAVHLQPNNVEALNNLALMLIGQRQLDEARSLLERVVGLAPNFAGGLVSLAALCFEQGDLEAALEAARKAVQLDPQNAAAQAQLGAVLLKLERHEEAIEPLRKAVTLAPRYAQASEHLGLCLMALKRMEEAEACLKTAAQLEPSNTRILGNFVALLSALRRWEEIVSVASQVIERQPDSPELLHNVGVAYLRLKRPRQAIPVLQQSIRLRPSPASCITLGWSYMADSRIEDARASFEKALQLDPASPEALAGLAAAYRDLGFQEEALATYRRSLALNPNQPDTHSALVYNLHFSWTVTPEEIFQEHLQWARCHAVPPRDVPRQYPNDPAPDRRLRIGYVSADFAWHVMGYYIELILEAHDHTQFEIFCYANLGQPDDKTQRLQQLAHHWRNIFDVHDDEAERMVRQDRIDILIDLNGHTANNRLRLFARKPAPVQASHFGYMDTTGVPTIDYRITDAVCDPPGMTERYHTEQLVRLPEILWCYRPNVSLPINALPAASAGHLTLGVLNYFSKITPPGIAAWSRILSHLPTSRLLLLASTSEAVNRRLRDAFAAHGIDPQRLTLVGRQSPADYFKLYHQLDFMLDPFPYSGCNTTCDALWMGVPVVTLAGKTSLARQGASPLAHLGLNDLITESEDGYVETAVRLGTDVPRLAELRSTLRERMSRSTLMHPERFTRQLEAAYRWMWIQWCHSKG